MSDETCPYCSKVVDRTDKDCPHCGKRITAKAILDDPPGGLPAPPPLAVGVPTTTTVLLIVAFVLGGLGFLLLSEATRGVGFICLGCLFAVWGRILQAAAQHRDAMRRPRG